MSAARRSVDVESPRDAGAMMLRTWRSSDCEAIYRIANEPAVRAVSFSPEPIAWEHHVEWYERALAADAGRLFAIDVAGVVAGYVRCTTDGVISIALAESFRGRGLAVPALRTAVARLSAQPWPEIRAYIKPDNLASMRAFVAAGFRDRGVAKTHEQECRCLTYALGR